tara:strand:+ start:156 stop:704 length:549 start_codon:yes stop_codon:yes gene_type:complete
MNMFVLDELAKKAAEYHCDKHVVKMILESAQMKSTAHWLHLLWSNNKSLKDFKRVRDAKSWLLENTDPVLHPPYAMTHVRHPCTLWVSSTVENYMWHYDLLFYLCKEYTKRYGKIHKTANYLSWFKNNIPQGMKSSGLEDFVICMKEEYKINEDAVASYRNYYKKDKVRFAKWKLNNVPSWF